MNNFRPLVKGEGIKISLPSFVEPLRNLKVAPEPAAFRDGITGFQGRLDLQRCLTVKSSVSHLTTISLLSSMATPRSVDLAGTEDIFLEKQIDKLIV